MAYRYCINVFVPKATADRCIRKRGSEPSSAVVRWIAAQVFCGKCVMSDVFRYFKRQQSGKVECIIEYFLRLNLKRLFFVNLNCRKVGQHWLKFIQTLISDVNYFILTVCENVKTSASVAKFNSRKKSTDFFIE